MCGKRDGPVESGSEEPASGGKVIAPRCASERTIQAGEEREEHKREFECKIFAGFTLLGILEEIQKFMIELQCEPEQLKGRIIFMSMYNDIEWGERGNTEKCIMNSITVANHARRFLLGRWSFLGPGSEMKWYGTHSDKPAGNWDKTAERMMLNFAEKLSSFLSRHQRPGKRRVKKQRKGKSAHFNGSEETMELILRTIISANQLSIYGAVADLCKELFRDSEVSGELAANEDLESMGIPQNFLLLILTPSRSCRETCCKIMSINSNNFLNTRNCPNCARTPV